MSALALAPQPVPLTTDVDGVVRVGGTRVTLVTIVGAFQRGATPEEIAGRYPTVALVDVYSTVAFYLTNRQEVDAYLREGRAAEDSIRDEERSRWDQTGIRERLLARGSR
jgi:uncharacterized protein (DUF433 family)